MSEHFDATAALRLAELTDEDLARMDRARLARLLRATQRGLRAVRAPEAERALLDLSRRANLAAARCDW